MALPSREVNGADGIVVPPCFALTSAGAARNLAQFVVPAISRGEACGGEVGNPAVVILSALKLVVVALDTALTAPVIVAVALFDERAAYRICQLWARMNLLLYGVRVCTRRTTPLDPSRPYVFVSNHRSQFDILASVVALTDFQLRWVAKVELTRVPVFGWALKNTGHIIIDRSDHHQAVASLRAARAKMEQGVSVMIFPEGTRSSAEEELLPFKKGGFMLALETGFPIVPVVIRGSRAILPRGSWQPASGEIEVIVGAPILVEGVTREELIERARAFMLAHLREEGAGERGSVAAAL
jgi:1-acyl-sn-glycerol-3-phosphate acyltransferase